MNAPEKKNVVVTLPTAGCLIGLAVLTGIQTVVSAVFDPLGLNFPAWTPWTSGGLAVALMLAAVFVCRRPAAHETPSDPEQHDF